MTHKIIVRMTASDRHPFSQDNHYVWSGVYLGKKTTLLCVADGHGGKRYIRSHIGSAAIGPMFRRLLEEGVPVEELPQALADAFHDFCRRDLRKYPLTAREKDSLWLEGMLHQEESHIKIYGSTCAAAILCEDECHFLAIGDSSVVGIDDTGSLCVLPHDPACVDHRTTSMVHNEAGNLFRMVTFRPMAAVCLYTDGCGRGSHYDLFQTLKQEDTVSAVESFMAKERVRLADDQTVVLYHTPLAKDMVKEVPRDRLSALRRQEYYALRNYLQMAHQRASQMAPVKQVMFLRHCAPYIAAYKAMHASQEDSSNFEV